MLLARVAELVDALDLGSSTLTGVGVRVPPFVLNDANNKKKRVIKRGHICSRINKSR